MPDKMKISILQVSVIVKNLEAAMQRYTSLLGIGPFCVYTVDTSEVPGVTYRGQRGDYKVRVGMAKVAGAVIELIEQQRGESIYTEFLRKHGEGVHHIGLIVDDMKEAFKQFAGHGFTTPSQDGPIVNEKPKRDGRFTYFDTEQKFGTTLELLDVPDNILASWGFGDSGHVAS